MRLVRQTPTLQQRAARSFLQEHMRARCRRLLKTPKTADDYSRQRIQVDKHRIALCLYLLRLVAAEIEADANSPTTEPRP